ncbi:SDR family oxidoreductase [Paraburkholderia youngii]|uniref:SDR family oxidoreductase n=1 Tax=Paraburkholderia youngii TaxID=2782701 RepID=UPI003D1DA40B
MNKHVLVTGARGLLGAEVIARLTAMGYPVVAFLRSEGPVVRNDGTPLAATTYDGHTPAAGTFACVRGDVAEPHLGLDPHTYEALRATTGTIVHCAALTSFGRKPEVYDAINFRGTERIVEFAQPRDDAPIPLLYVSTAYVCGERPGVFSEDDLDLGQRLGNPYEQSKYRAEQSVRAAMRSGLPAAVLRPSIIVGDSASGVIRKFDTLYTVVRLTAAGLVRTMPGDYGATLNIVPIDWVADCVVEALVKFPLVRGRTLHLTSGAPTTLREINDVCAEFPSFHVPRYVPRHVFDAAAMKPLERRYYDEVVKLYESYLTRQVRFARDATAAILPALPRATGKTLLRRIFRYGIAAGYFVPRTA